MTFLDEIYQKDIRGWGKLSYHKPVVVCQRSARILQESRAIALDSLQYSCSSLAYYNLTLWYDFYMLAFSLVERSGANDLLYSFIHCKLLLNLLLAAKENTATRDYCLQTFKHWKLANSNLYTGKNSEKIYRIFFSKFFFFSKICINEYFFTEISRLSGHLRKIIFFTNFGEKKKKNLRKIFSQFFPSVCSWEK